MKSNRLSSSLALLVVIILFCGCTKDNRIAYEVRLDANFDLPNGLNTIETHYIYVRNVKMLYGENIALRNIDTSTIDAINVSFGRLLPRFNSTNLNYFQSVVVNVVSRIDPKNRNEIYYLEQIPNNQRAELRLLNSISNLREILKEENVDLEFRFQFRTFPPPAVSLTLDFGYVIYLKG